MTEKLSTQTTQVKITSFYKIKSDLKQNNSYKRAVPISLTKTISPKHLKLDNDVTIISSDDEEIENVHHKTPSPATPSVSTSKTPSSRERKYFSPSKKRLVSVSPNKINIRRNLIGAFSKNVNKPPIKDEKNSFEYNDKTKNFLQMINNYLNNPSLTCLLEEETTSLLRSMLHLPKPSAIVICRMFWRKRGWYKQDSISDIIKKNIYPVVEIDKKIMEYMFQSLVSLGVLDKGNNQNMSTIEDFTEHLIQADDIKDVCNFLKLKRTSKKEGIKALKRFAETTSSIHNYFLGRPQGNMERVVDVLRKKVGECYRLSEKAYRSIHRLYILTYLGVPYEFIRDHTLEHMVDYERRGFETFPVDNNIQLDSPSIIFQNAAEFEHYVTAIELYEEVLCNTNKDYRSVVVQQIYNLYKGLTITEMQRYSSLPIWLRRYTPSYVYIKTMMEGLNSLKSSNKSHFYEEAVNILTSLINQDVFKVQHKAKWCDEKALILHRYLKRSDEAAKELVNGFVMNIPEYQKDCLRPRALYLANLKSTKIVDCLKQLLREYGTRHSTLENTLKSTTVSILPMEKKGMGKSTYEIHNKDGTRDVVGVEECARRWYADNTGFTEGGHWEGKIIINLFFLLFWNIIYTPLPNVDGIYLSRYQRFPLDLFSESFYTNRKHKIDERLRWIKDKSVDTLLNDMERVWSSRPVSELSGLSRDASGWRGVVKGLGAGKLCLICERVAKDYRYTHSGFPDLTLYDPRTNRVKFVEVKSDKDKPSMKQIQWMHYMQRHGIDTEFCYVGAKTDAPKSRRRQQILTNDS